MTEPTDAELAALRTEFGITSNGRGIKEFAQVADFARAVLAKWGTPPAGAGEPVGWRYRPSAVWEDYVLTDDPEKAARARGNGLHVEALCLTTPQPTQAQAETPCRKNPFYHGPRNCIRGTVGCCEDHGAKTQAQAGAVPMSEHFLQMMIPAKAEPSDFAAGVRFAEAHHGIKGGQHG